MKFNVEHVFTGVAPATVEAVFFDEAFNVALCEAVDLERELLEREQHRETLQRKTRIRPRRAVPKPLEKAIGSNRLEYIEHIDYSFANQRGQWRVIPAALADKISAAGELGFHPQGDGASRWVRGEVNVKLFGVGGMAERFIVSDIEKSYERAAEFMRRWLAEQRQG